MHTAICTQVSNLVCNLIKDVGRSLAQTDHGHRQIMGTDRSWAQTDHGRRQIMGADRSWAQSGHGRSQVMDTDRSWAQTDHGRRVIKEIRMYKCIFMTCCTSLNNEF